MECCQNITQHAHFWNWLEKLVKNWLIWHFYFIENETREQEIQTSITAFWASLFACDTFLVAILTTRTILNTFRIRSSSSCITKSSQATINVAKLTLAFSTVYRGTLSRKKNKDNYKNQIKKENMNVLFFEWLTHWLNRGKSRQ